MGHFVHLLRRNVPMLYLIENNGVYGLTKGQFSPTADYGSKLKTGVVNDLPAVDLCALAIELGCGFVARSFSADRKQLLQILKAAVAHRGLALVDIISPCVTFNDHPGSTKSYDYGREHETPIHEIGFVPTWEKAAQEVEVPEDKAIDVDMPNGGQIKIRKIARSHDPRDRNSAEDLLRDAAAKQEFLTGLFYVAPESRNLLDHLNLGDAPLATLPASKTRPSREVLAEIMEELRHHGYQIGPGTLYPILHGLESGGMITSSDEIVEGKRRKNFRITKRGRKLLEEARAKLKELASEVIDDRDARAERGARAAENDD